MNRLRFYDLLTSRFPEVIGACAGDIPVVAAKANEAQLRLITAEEQPDEGFFGTYARMAFTVTTANPYITTPRGVARMTVIDICKKPVMIRNEWYEFLDFGTGLRPTGCCSPLCQNLGVFERPPVVTPVDFTPGNILRVYATDPGDIEAGKRVFFSGLDTNDARIYSLDGLARVNGKFVLLQSPFADLDTPLNVLDGIQKDITIGPVQIFGVDPVTSAQTLLVTMEAGETTAWYRRYYLNGLPRQCLCKKTIDVVCMVKLEHVPMAVPTDYTLIQSIPAFIDEARAIRMEGSDIPGAQPMAAQAHVRALKYLFGELDHYIGKQRVSITVPLFGSQPLRQVI